MDQEPPRGQEPDSSDEFHEQGSGPVGPPPVGVWQIWSARRLLVFGFFLFLTNLVVQVEVYRVSDNLFLPTLVGGLVAVVLPCQLVSRFNGSGLAADWQLGLPPLAVSCWAALLALGGLYPTAELAGLSSRIHPVDPEWIALFNENLPRTTLDTVIAVVAVVVVAPLAEEILFRGLLHRLARRAWGPWAATAISSLSFALVHAEPWVLFGLIGLGILLAFVYEATRSVTACVIVHALHNAISLTVILKAPEGAEAELPTFLQGSWALLASCLLLIFAGRGLLGAVGSGRRKG